MYIRQKNNKSGTVSVQIVDTSRGRYKVVRTLGCSMDPLELDRLNALAVVELSRLSQPLNIEFDLSRERELVDLFFEGIEQIRLVGPELILGKIFDEIGFNRIRDELFRHLIVTRLCFPESSLKATDYLFQSKGITLERESVFKYLHKLSRKQKSKVQELCHTHLKKLDETALNTVMYFVTPLGFEAGDPEINRIGSLPREEVVQHPHMSLGLFVSSEGFPLAYELFEGQKFQICTTLELLDSFKTKARAKSLVVVTEAGILTEDCLTELCEKEHKFLTGIRLKSEKSSIQSLVLGLNFESDRMEEIQVDKEIRLIVCYSRGRAEKERINHKRGVEKLERAIKAGRLSNKNINNRGYNKYLLKTEKNRIGIDYEKLREDERWNGLKGYLTNTDFSKEQVVHQYQNLCRYGKSFRISQGDLRLRPAGYKLNRLIDAQLCIAFCACKVFMELERELKCKGFDWSPNKAIEIAKTILEITILTPFSKTKESRLHLENEEQSRLLELLG